MREHGRVQEKTVMELYKNDLTSPCPWCGCRELRNCGGTSKSPYSNTATLKIPSVCTDDNDKQENNINNKDRSTKLLLPTHYTLPCLPPSLCTLYFILFSSFFLQAAAPSFPPLPKASCGRRSNHFCGEDLICIFMTHSCAVWGQQV